MNQFIKIIVVFFLLISSVLAENLEIKVNQSPINLPYWRALEPHYGGVLIVRGGEPVQWSDSLASLAKLLAANGWSSVLLNCNADTPISWITLLPEAISALRQDKNSRIILIHYGEQLNMTFDYFSKPQAKMINGLILLSAYDIENSVVKLPSLRFPILDIVGQFDYDLVLNQVEVRAKEYKLSNYLLLKIPGADHTYEYTQKLLASFMSGWMLKLPESITSPPPIGKKSYLEPIFSLESHLVAIQDLRKTPNLFVKRNF